MDKDALAGFIFSAAEETFATMLGLRIAPGDPSIGSLETVTASDRVVALIGLAGHCNGTGMIACSPELACKLSSRMLLTESRVVDSVVLDAMSEISNMIFGNIKTMLEGQVGLLGLSIPTVVFGRNFFTGSVGEQWVAVPLKVAEHNLELRMCLSRNHSIAKQSSGRQPATVSF
jgi:chemotaxis protein CheX